MPSTRGRPEVEIADAGYLAVLTDCIDRPETTDFREGAVWIEKAGDAF
jgi:hypothetical protein